MNAGLGWAAIQSSIVNQRQLHIQVIKLDFVQEHSQPLVLEGISLHSLTKTFENTV